MAYDFDLVILLYVLAKQLLVLILTPTDLQISVTMPHQVAQQAYAKASPESITPEELLRLPVSSSTEVLSTHFRDNEMETQENRRLHPAVSEGRNHTLMGEV